MIRRAAGRLSVVDYRHQNEPPAWHSEALALLTLGPQADYRSGVIGPHATGERKPGRGGQPGWSARGKAFSSGRSPMPWYDPYGVFGVLYSTSFWNGFQTVS